MSTLDTDQTSEMVISSRLDEVVPATNGVYYEKHTMTVDATNLTLVRVKREITLGS